MKVIGKMAKEKYEKKNERKRNQQKNTSVGKGRKNR